MLNVLSCRNYRSLETVDMPLDRVTAVVGPNGMGKTKGDDGPRLRTTISRYSGDVHSTVMILWVCVCSLEALRAGKKDFQANCGTHLDVSGLAGPESQAQQGGLMLDYQALKLLCWRTTKQAHLDRRGGLGLCTTSRKTEYRALRFACVWLVDGVEVRKATRSLHHPCTGIDS